MWDYKILEVYDFWSREPFMMVYDKREGFGWFFSKSGQKSQIFYVESEYEGAANTIEVLVVLFGTFLLVAWLLKQRVINLKRSRGTF